MVFVLKCSPDDSKLYWKVPGKAKPLDKAAFGDCRSGH